MRRLFSQRGAPRLLAARAQGSRARKLSLPPPAVDRRRADAHRVRRAVRPLFLSAGHPARPLPDAGREQSRRDRPDRAQPRRDHRSQRRRARAKLLGVHAGDHAFARDQSRGDDRPAGQDRRSPAARPQALQAPAGRIEAPRERAAAHAPDRRGSRALRGQSIPVSRRRHQGAAVPAISVRRDRFAADRLREPHQRPRPRAHRRMERDRQLQGLRLHRQGRRRTVVRARAARRHRRRGSRGRFQRPRRAHAVAHAADIRQQPAARAGHPSAEDRRGGVRHPARGAGRDRSGDRRDPRLRLAARVRSEPVRRRHRSVVLGTVERFARQAAAQPTAARRVPAGIDDQAVPRAGGADLGQAHGDADDLRSRVLPDRRQHAPLPRRQARRPRLRRHDQVDRRVLRHLLLHAGRRDRHRRHLRVHVAVRIRPEDRHRSRGRVARRAAVADLEARALLREQLPRGASQMVSGRFDLGRHRPGIQRLHAAAAGPGDRDHRQRRRGDAPARGQGDREHPHRRAARIAPRSRRTRSPSSRRISPSSRRR